MKLKTTAQGGGASTRMKNNVTILEMAALAGLTDPGAPEAGYYKTVDCGHVEFYLAGAPWRICILHGVLTEWVRA
jgi:hypothetical protein